MKKVYVTFFKCDFCEKQFTTIRECVDHEKTIHLCPICEHSYLMYGCETNCELENKHKKCKYIKRG